MNDLLLFFIFQNSMDVDESDHNYSNGIITLKTHNNDHNTSTALHPQVFINNIIDDYKIY